jgi:hydrogenase nickel incorporation protein HypB
MILGDPFKNKRYYHHKNFHKHHHSHSKNSPTDVSTQKSGTREIKVIRRVLDVNDKMAAENRKLFAK